MYAFILGAVVATATPGPMVAPADWIARVDAITFVSASGDSASLSHAAEKFALKPLPPGTEGSAPNVIADRRRGLIRVCFQPQPDDASSCRYRMDLRTADTGIPPGTPDTSLEDAAIGMTFAQLLAYLHSEPRMRKAIDRGPAGDPVMVWSDVQKGGENCNSGQCAVMNTIYTNSLYFLADDVVVAVAWMRYNEASGAF